MKISLGREQESRGNFRRRSAAFESIGTRRLHGNDFELFARERHGVAAERRPNVNSDDEVAALARSSLEAADNVFFLFAARFVGVVVKRRLPLGARFGGHGSVSRVGYGNSKSLVMQLDLDNRIDYDQNNFLLWVH